MGEIALSVIGELTRPGLSLRPPSNERADTTFRSYKFLRFEELPANKREVEMDLIDAPGLYQQHAFQNALPVPDLIDTRHRHLLTLQVRQTEQFLGLYDPEGHALTTTVWGYGVGNQVSYPGPTILAYAGQPLEIHWQNQLPVEGYPIPVDTTLNIADPVRRPLDAGFIPIVTHLHGGHTEPSSDGHPEAWFTQQRSGPGGTGPLEVGPHFVSQTATYENDQPGATLWYHDHALGLTRLNVYMGLAGFYLLQDENRLDLAARGVLPSGAYDLGLAIQDRAFTSNGQLYYPAYKGDVLPGTSDTVGDVVPQAFYDARGESAPSAMPEFFGDVLLVNGMAWPKLPVAEGEYQFRLLNGSDSRFYVLKVSNPSVAVHLVGTDSGLLPSARTIMDGDGQQEPNEFLLLAPGDRVDLVFDFSALKDGDTVQLLNVGPAYEPFKGISADGELAGGVTAAGPDDPVGAVMQFDVTSTLPPSQCSVTDGVPLATNFTHLAADANNDGVADAADRIRRVGLFEETDQYGRIQTLLGTAEAGPLHSSLEQPDGAFGPLRYDAPVTERPLLGSTEQWDMFNFTEDAHPIHLHLVHFQAVERQSIDFRDEDGNGVPDDTNADGQITYGSGAADFAQADIWIGDPIALRPEETGWQDTLQVGPHQMLSIVATFDRAGDYVWHCHILSHEDDEMMRPFTVEDPGVLLT
jgi:spore coat protein A